MAPHTVALQDCPATATQEEVSAKVAEIMDALPGMEDRLARARRVLVKINLSPGAGRTYQERPIDHVDPGVYEALALYLRDRTEAEILVGDGTDGEGPEKAAEQQGHLRVVEKFGHRFVNLNQPPFTTFTV